MDGALFLTNITKYGLIKAGIGHKLIDEKPFFAFQAKTKELNQIPVVKLL